MRVWKFPFEVQDKVSIEMPKGARLLSIQSYDSASSGLAMAAWALIDEHEKERVTLDLVIFGTGHPIDPDLLSGLEYITTIQQMRGALVWHVFERTKYQVSHGKGL